MTSTKDVYAYEDFELRYNDAEDNPINETQLRDIENIMFVIQVVMGCEISAGWIFETLHGHIVKFETRGSRRLYAHELEWLAMIKPRWFEIVHGKLAFGI